MKQKWGRTDDAGEFPSDRAAWTIGAFCLALLSVFAIGCYRYMKVWTPLQRHYMTTYVGTPIAGAMRTDAGYTLLMVVTRKGTRMALDNEVQPFVTDKGESTFTLTDEATKIGDLKLEWQYGRYNNAKLHEFLGHWIYQDQTLTDLAKPALWRGLSVLLVSLIVAIPKDAARARVRRHGRRLKGPELVTPRVFNRRMHSDGIGFVQQQSFTGKMLGKKRRVCIPRDLESSHFLVIGDSGKGKSALIPKFSYRSRSAARLPSCTIPRHPPTTCPTFFLPPVVTSSLILWTNGCPTGLRGMNCGRGPMLSHWPRRCFPTGTMKIRSLWRPREKSLRTCWGFIRRRKSWCGGCRTRKRSTDE